MAHIRVRHRYRKLSYMLAVTSACPYWMSTFTTKAGAAKHIERAIRPGGSCKTDQSRWETPLREAQHFCSFGDKSFDSTHQLLWHLRDHVKGPEEIAVFLQRA